MKCFISLDRYKRLASVTAEMFAMPSRKRIIPFTERRNGDVGAVTGDVSEQKLR
jgi:hypothetical protein